MEAISELPRATQAHNALQRGFKISRLRQAISRRLGRVTTVLLIGPRVDVTFKCADCSVSSRPLRARRGVILTSDPFVHVLDYPSHSTRAFFSRMAEGDVCLPAQCCALLTIVELNTPALRPDVAGRSHVRYGPARTCRVVCGLVIFRHVSHDAGTTTQGPARRPSTTEAFQPVLRRIRVPPILPTIEPSLPLTQSHGQVGGTLVGEPGLPVVAVVVRRKC